MDELLSLEFIAKYLSPIQVKSILFVWSIVKCTFLLVVSIKLLRIFANGLFKKVLSRISVQERKQQLITLKTIIMHVIEAVIVAVYVMNMLNIFGIDVRPILATAGVMGVAIGFGSKRFVEDAISGLIILLEGQVRVGDYVEIQGVSGVVEKITIPLITIRSATTGSLCFMRCGYIDSIINYTMNYSYAFFAFDVAYKENVTHVINVLKSCFDEIRSNPEYSDKIIDDIEIFGLDEFKESSLCIKARIKTKPKEQWSVKREFNKMIKERFDKEGIEIPFNQLVITQAQ